MRDTDLFIFGAGAVLVIAGIGWMTARTINAKLPAGALDITSPNNLAYEGVNSVGAAITGDRDFSLGVWLYEKTHPATVAAENAITQPVEIRAVPASRSAPIEEWEPWNPN